MSDKELFYKKIKAKRQALGYSLEQISENTKINIKYLRAIEEGDFSILPQTYIKLFLKSYAEELNLDASKILEEFERYKFTEGLGGDKTGDVENETKKVNKLSISPGGNKKNLATIIIIIVIFFIIIFTLKKVLDTSSKEKDNSIPLNVSEIPIEEEKTDTLKKETTQVLPETLKTKINQDTTQFADSSNLVLRANFQDSCWINLVIDEEDTIDAIFLENNLVNWSAENNFKMKIGKPKAITSLSLNGRDLGPVGNDTPVILFINQNGIYRRSKLY
ncbi:MAG: helix-turn-helix domain-containing protein [Candidatus Marinimicrobia bacterium]|nr:helix-turn-helix domain-containing protein [Candidatus Neomarinimicrobiota bacterium]